MSFRFLSAAVVISVVLAVAAGNARGDGFAGPRRAPAFSLTVSPARLVVAAGTGATVRNVVAYNTGRTPLDVNVVLTGFQQVASGAVVFGRPGSESDVDWIKIKPASFRLPPGAKRHVRVRIDTPADIEPGDHEVGLTFLVPAPSSSANLTINRGIGAQMLIRAPGPVTRDTAVTALEVPQLSLGGDVPLRLTLRNGGTVHRDFFAPKHRIVATANNERVPFPSLTVLGGVTRTADTTWANPPWLCHCRVAVSIPNGRGGTSTVSAAVWIIPVWQILGAILLLIGSALLVRWRRRRHVAALEAARQQGYEAATKQVT